MSTDASQEMTREEKFFGVSTPVGKKAGTVENDSGEDDIKLDIVDDRPPEDQKFKQPDPDDDDPGDDDGPTEEELATYSAKVRKRINKLNYEKNEMRRRAEEADRMREEAVNVAHSLHQRIQQNEGMISQGQQAIIARAKESAERAVQMARASYRDAYDKGDTDKVIEAQEALIAAQAEQREVAKAEQEAQFRAQQRARQPQQPQTSQQQPNRPAAPRAPDPDSPEAKWAAENPWFGKNKVMTATAYGIHEELITERGITPDKPDYYKTINSEMRKRFPEYFQDTTDNADEDTGSGRQPTSTHRAPPNVVGSSTRNTGSRTAKTMKITSTQAALARRLGITPEQYAKELVKESQRNG